MRMLYVFGPFELDTEKGELREGGTAVPIEPQVFALLRLLIEHRNRLVSKDELVEHIWCGRIVSDAAIASRIKSARRALGDDGEAQRFIRTTPKLGFRFVGEVTEHWAERATAHDVAPPAEPLRAPSARPSVAVLPFEFLGSSVAYAPVADALPHEIIVELSRLRWLFVIARGSSFQLRGRLDSKAVRAALGVRYCVSGSLEASGDRISVNVELSDTESGAVVWGESYRGEVGAVHDIRARIVFAVVNALELQIPAHEATRALKAPENLDAWSAYHLGLRQMYMFSKEGNERAAAYFGEAVRREPNFARAYAGLSFTHFENAFLRVSDDPIADARFAKLYAEKGLAADPLDPFCNLVAGRVSWLDGELEAALPWLDRALDLNGSFAQARYSRAWTETLLGDGAGGRDNVERAMELSPLDPLLYAMLGVKGMSHLVSGEVELAAHWAERAARAPRAHPLVEMIAAVANSLNGDEERARRWAGSARRRNPRLRSEDFLDAFPFREPALRERLLTVLKRL